MKINVIGSGAFGTFLAELLEPYFGFSDAADTVIFAVPISAYDSLANEHRDRHIVNVCSVQKPSTEMVLRHTTHVTSIHPLFGRRTPATHRNAILTHTLPPDGPFKEAEAGLLERLAMVCEIKRVDPSGAPFTPDTHDQLMAKTHVAAVVAARQMKVFVDRASDVPDEYVPNSFRLMREFVQTLDDMPQGTIESIMANPYF